MAGTRGICTKFFGLDSSSGTVLYRISLLAPSVFILRPTNISHNDYLRLDCVTRCPIIKYLVEIVIIIITDHVTDIRIVYVFVLFYTSYFHIVEVKYG